MIQPTQVQQKNIMEFAWTTVNSMNTARNDLAGAGTQTSAVGFGGYTPTTGATEKYDGTSWTTSPASLNTARIV
jgi:hypothetical protein